MKFGFDDEQCYRTLTSFPQSCSPQPKYREGPTWDRTLGRGSQGAASALCSLEGSTGQRSWECLGISRSVRGEEAGQGLVRLTGSLWLMLYKHCPDNGGSPVPGGNGTH